MKKILLTTNTFSSYKRQDLSIEKMSLLKNKNQNVECALIQYKNEKVPYNKLKILDVLDRGSHTTLGTKKSLPYIKDLFDASAEASEEIFVFSNSDITLSQKLIDYINNNEIEALGVSRIDILEVDNLSQPSQIIRMEPAGFDTWIVNKSWWFKHRHLFPDMLLGRPEFDVAYTAIMDLNSINVHESTEYLTYHYMHEIVSFERDECYHFNVDQKNNKLKPLFDWWGYICNSTYLDRSDFGQFLNFKPNEKDIIKHYVAEAKNNSKLKEFIL
jgi:hypothetical protein